MAELTRARSGRKLFRAQYDLSRLKLRNTILTQLLMRITQLILCRLNVNYCLQQNNYICMVLLYAKILASYFLSVISSRVSECLF